MVICPKDTILDNFPQLHLASCHDIRHEMVMNSVLGHVGLRLDNPSPHFMFQQDSGISGKDAGGLSLYCNAAFGKRYLQYLSRLW